MKHLTRRKFLIPLAGAASLGEPFWRQSVFAAMDAKPKTAPVSAPLAAPTEFTNRLRLPGARGLYTAAAAKDVRQITVSEVIFEVVAKLPSPFWAYVAVVGGKK